jgi:hypothetical protein
VRLRLHNRPDDDEKPRLHPDYPSRSTRRGAAASLSCLAPLGGTRERGRFANCRMSKPKKPKAPRPQPAFAGGPPRPPKRTARGLEDLPPENHPDRLMAAARAASEKADKVTEEYLEYLKHQNET